MGLRCRTKKEKVSLLIMRLSNDHRNGGERLKLKRKGASGQYRAAGGSTLNSAKVRRAGGS